MAQANDKYTANAESRFYGENPRFFCQTPMSVLAHTQKVFEQASSRFYPSRKLFLAVLLCIKIIFCLGLGFVHPNCKFQCF